MIKLFHNGFNEKILALKFSPLEIEFRASDEPWGTTYVSVWVRMFKHYFRWELSWS
jgi:hypothetical protein